VLVPRARGASLPRGIERWCAKAKTVFLNGWGSDGQLAKTVFLNGWGSDGQLGGCSNHRPIGQRGVQAPQS
jgi:hypothetical protein